MVCIVCSADQARCAAHQPLERKLQQRVRVMWQGQQLGPALRRLAAVHQIPLWIDRRVDPQLPVQAAWEQQTLRSTFRRLAAQHQLSTTILGPLLYVGPSAAAGRLADLAAQTRKSLTRLPPVQQQPWLQQQPVQWARLGQPRALLQAVCRQADIALEGAEKVPHDLWPALELPPLAVVDQVILLLLGFDLTCQVSAEGGCRVVPLQPVPAHKSGGQPSPHRVPSQPSPVQGEGGIARQVYHLKINQQPLGAVLDHLRKQLQLEIRWSTPLQDRAGELRQQRVSCAVRGGDLDQLLSSLLGSAGLTYRRIGHVLILQPVE